MATFKKFEEIAAWQKSRELTNQIYKITGQGAFSKDYGLKDQIRRCFTDQPNDQRLDELSKKIWSERNKV